MQRNFLHEGREANSNGDWPRARYLLEQALREEETAEVCEELARSCWWLNDFTCVFEYRTKAFNLFLDKNDRHGAARCACWLGEDLLEMKGDFAVANGWFQRAENLLEGMKDSKELCFVKLLKARIAFITESNNDNALKLAEESLQLSKSLESQEDAMMAEALKGFILITEGKMGEGMALLDEATLLATTNETGDANLATIACCFLIDACERVRDYERAGQWCNRVKEICKRWKHDAMFASCRNKYASVLIWNGDWEKAEEELKSAAKELRELRPSQVRASTIRLADLKRKQGRWEEAATLLKEAGSHPLALLNSAAFAFDREEFEQALNLAERYVRQIPAKDKTGKIAGLELLLRIHLKQGRMEEAVDLLNKLKEVAAAVNTASLHAAVLCAEGILNHATGNVNVARQNLEDAVDIYDKITAPFESARARMELSEVLMKVDQHKQADAALNIALKTFQELGAEKDAGKTRTMLKNMHRTGAGINTYEFTGRELEVLRLIAEGKNNEEIAEQLFLSVRTIEKHITNLYTKMGVSGKSARAFAASYAIKHKLVLS